MTSWEKEFIKAVRMFASLGANVSVSASEKENSR